MYRDNDAFVGYRSTFRRPTLARLKTEANMTDTIIGPTNQEILARIGEAFRELKVINSEIDKMAKNFDITIGIEQLKLMIYNQRMMQVNNELFGHGWFTFAQQRCDAAAILYRRLYNSLINQEFTHRQGMKILNGIYPSELCPPQTGMPDRLHEG